MYCFCLFFLILPTIKALLLLLLLFSSSFAYFSLVHHMLKILMDCSDHSCDLKTFYMEISTFLKLAIVHLLAFWSNCAKNLIYLRKMCAYHFTLL